MGTISKEIADRVIAGEFDDDDPKRIVEYTNACGVIVYGLTCDSQDPDTYLYESKYITNPKIYWDKMENEDE